MGVGGSAGAAVGGAAGAGTAGDGLAWADTPRHVLATAEIDSSGDTTESYEATTSCSILPGILTIDWALPALLLSLILVRRRIGVLFVRLRSAAAPNT